VMTKLAGHGSHRDRGDLFGPVWKLAIGGVFTKLHWP